MTINEVFADYVKDPWSKKKQYEVYKNPTSNELRDLIKAESPGELRVIIDKKDKNIYVFNVNLLHDEAAKKVLGFTTHDKRERFYHGIANKTGMIHKNKFLTHDDVQEIKKWLKPPMRIDA